MNRNIVFVLFLIASVALIWIPGALALPLYLDAYNATYIPNGTCDVCHINPAGGGPRNSYGMLFENQSNHATDPHAALIAIGPPPGLTATITATVPATSTATSTPITTQTPISTETPAITTEIPTETPTITTEIPTETPIVTTEIPTETSTPTTPGFEQSVFIAGLLASYFLLKRSNKN